MHCSSDSAPASSAGATPPRPTDKQRAYAYADILHELIRPDNGYCNQCGGAWSYRAEGRWSYFDGDHTPNCIGRRVLEKHVAAASRPGELGAATLRVGHQQYRRVPWAARQEGRAWEVFSANCWFEVSEDFAQVLDALRAATPSSAPSAAGPDTPDATRKTEDGR